MTTNISHLIDTVAGAKLQELKAKSNGTPIAGQPVIPEIKDTAEFSTTEKVAIGTGVALASYAVLALAAAKGRTGAAFKNFGEFFKHPSNWFKKAAEKVEEAAVKGGKEAISKGTKETGKEAAGKAGKKVAGEGAETAQQALNKEYIAKNHEYFTTGKVRRAKEESINNYSQHFLDKAKATKKNAEILKETTEKVVSGELKIGANGEIVDKQLARVAEKAAENAIKR